MTDLTGDNAILTNDVTAGRDIIATRNLRGGTLHDETNQLFDCSWWDAPEKLMARSIIVAEIDDKSDLGLRRVNGSATNRQPLVANDVISGIWFQAWGSNGSFQCDANQAPAVGRSAEIMARCRENPTGTARGGSLSLMTTPNGDCTTREALTCMENRRTVFWGCAMPDTTGTSIGDLNSSIGGYQEYHPEALLTSFHKEPTGTNSERVWDILHGQGYGSPKVYKQGFSIGLRSNTNPGRALIFYRKPTDGHVLPMFALGEDTGSVMIGTDDCSNDAVHNLVLAHGEVPSTGQSGKVHICAATDGNIYIRFPDNSIKKFTLAAV